MDFFKSFTRERRFSELSRAAQYCTLCPRMIHRSKVLTEANGNIYSRVLFIAEAPGRLGADRTGIPLFGDRTGEIFESLISNISWSRNDLFITNAVLCNPRGDNGNNGTPSKKETFNCSIYLQETIDLINPEVIITLGKVALDGLANIHPHSVSLTKEVSNLLPWNGRNIFPMYHPGPRALIHRSLAKQRADYIKLAKIVDPVKGLRKANKRHQLQVKLKLSNAEISPLHKMALVFINYFKEISLFKLTKLMYLTDLLALKELGRTISGDIYLRQQEGPWLPNLNKVLQSLDGDLVVRRLKNNKPYAIVGPNPSDVTFFNQESLFIFLRAINKYGRLNDAEIKTAAYLSEPMKYILREEKKGKDMRNIPIIYGDKTVTNLLDK